MDIWRYRDNKEGYRTLAKVGLWVSPAIFKTNKRASRRDSMKINEWGVFVERPDTSTYEIKLSKELASKLYDYIEKLKENDENILSGNTEGKILW